MDYTDVAGFVHTMINRWKPVYRKCDFIIDTTHGHTHDLIERIKQELEAQEVIFKKRRLNKAGKWQGRNRSESDDSQEAEVID